jgi:hypothetical protein
MYLYIYICIYIHHPYYASFGYHVANLFAPSSRCGNPYYALLHTHTHTHTNTHKHTQTHTQHPYYASFGYHVANLFAPSSRCGNPDELKHLIDECHAMGISVRMYT